MSFIVVHLTDLHMKESAKDNPVLAKVKRVCSALNGTVKKDDTVLLAFTGDLAFSGKKSEYNNCELFISSITEYICAQKNAKVHVAFVPGNHDCNFAENQDVRNALISSVKSKTSSLSSAIILSVSNVQKDFFEFAERNGNPWKNRISEALCIETDIGKVSIHLINSAWDSTLHEIPGQLLMPEVHIPEETTKDTALSLTLIHHPLHWLSPDSVHSLSETFRRYTDVLFVGHEHRADKLTMKGEKWTYSQFNGKELQNSECANDSSFSVYTWDNLQKVKILEYAWDIEKQFYDRVYESEQDVALNQMRTRGCVYPNSMTLEMLRDIGATIHHFRIDAVSLEDLYCWPEIDVLPTDESKVKNPVRISNDIPQNISNYRVPLIVGSPNCGKTSLLKSLYSYYLSQGICCLSCNGIDLVSSTESGITRIIEEQFCKQYNQNQLEEFRQMTTSSKVLLIDDFESMTFNLERQSRIINHLLESFQRVILFSGSDVDISMLLAIRFAGSDEKIVPLRIRPFGNKKRNELITKWYSLGDEYAFEDSEMKLKADQARDVIDGVLGSHRTIVPATPIVVISLLQNLEAFSTSTFAGSQYGYLYENLVNRSLAAIHNTNPGTMNIHVAVLSRIAYNMLIGKKKSFSEMELINLVHVFVADRLVPVDAIALLSNMMSVRLIKKDEGGSYRFSYPYIFYYFCGKYIATHIEEDAVKELVVYMSERLFIEDYGNIIIFVCHFCNSLHIIESVLLNSYSLFDKVHPFSFEEPQRILDLANNAIERFLVPKVVGQESEVKARREEMLKRMDEAGVRDGSVSPDENDNIRIISQPIKA